MNTEEKLKALQLENAALRQALQMKTYVIEGAGAEIEECYEFLRKLKRNIKSFLSAACETDESDDSLVARSIKQDIEISEVNSVNVTYYCEYLRGEITAMGNLFRDLLNNFKERNIDRAV